MYLNRKVVEYIILYPCDMQPLKYEADLYVSVNTNTRTHIHTYVYTQIYMKYTFIFIYI